MNPFEMMLSVFTATHIRIRTLFLTLLKCIYKKITEYIFRATGIRDECVVAINKKFFRKFLVGYCVLSENRDFSFGW